MGCLSPQSTSVLCDRTQYCIKFPSSSDGTGLSHLSYDYGEMSQIKRGFLNHGKLVSVTTILRYMYIYTLNDWVSKIW